MKLAIIWFEKIRFHHLILLLFSKESDLNQISGWRGEPVRPLGLEVCVTTAPPCFPPSSDPRRAHLRQHQRTFLTYNSSTRTEQIESNRKLITLPWSILLSHFRLESGAERTQVTMKWYWTKVIAVFMWVFLAKVLSRHCNLTFSC